MLRGPVVVIHSGKAYLRERWEPPNLPPEAPLFAAAEDPTVPTGKDLIQTWWERTETVVEREDKVRISDGRAHTRRRRFRSLPRGHDDKSVAFHTGWTLRKAETRYRNYLTVDWHEVLKAAKAADELAALRHLTHRLLARDTHPQRGRYQHPDEGAAQALASRQRHHLSGMGQRNRESRRGRRK